MLKKMMIKWVNIFFTEDEYRISSHKKGIDYSREVITSNIVPLEVMS